MPDIGNSAAQDTYKDLLQLPNSNLGADTTARTVETGNGATTPLQLATNKVVVKAPSGLAASANLIEVQDENGNVLSRVYADGYMFPITMTWTVAVSVPASVGNDKALRVRLLVPAKLITAVALAKTGPTGQALIFDINANGTSIWNNVEANQLQIAAGQTVGTTSTFVTSTFSANTDFTIDITQTGIGGGEGQDITVELLFYGRNSV